MERCIECSSYAINPRHDGRDGVSDLSLCNVCYWRKRATERLAMLKDILDILNFYKAYNLSVHIDKIIEVIQEEPEIGKD